MRLAHLETDPDVDLELVGRLDLEKLKSALPAAAASYAGLLDVDMRLRGRVSSFSEENATNVDADGRFKLAGFSWVDPELDMPVRIPALDLSLSPQRATIHALDMDLEAFTFSATGHLDNIVAWALTDASLSGELSLRSKRIDLDALAGGEDDSGEEGGSSIVVVPEGYDLVFDAQVGELIYGGHSFEDFKGRIIVRDGAVTLEDMKMTLLGGALGLDGSYAAVSAEAADLDLTLSFGDPEVAAALSRFEVLRKVAAIFEGAGGRFNTTLHVRTRLGPDLSPDYTSLWAEGRVRTFDVAFEPGFGASLASSLGAQKFSKMNMKDTRMRFQVDGGRVRFEPFDLSIGGVAATLSGASGLLDDRLDLVMELALPATQLQGSALASQLGALGEGPVPVRVKITGTRAAPKLSLDLAGAGQALVGDLKAEAQAQVDEVKQEVLEQVDAAADKAVEAARAKGDQLVAAAEVKAEALRSGAATQAEALRSEAKRQAKALRREAKGNPIKEAAADKAAEKIEADAEKAATKIEREANSKADALVSEAKRSRDQLVQEAEAKLQR
ncbi:MAG: hypothetical protein H6740_22295 [Alphaproteobacteria bacterium]|nr:hypothetical protein [Alphaproteobacteria bacterium]